MSILAIIAIHVFQLWHHGEQVFNVYIYMFSEFARFGVPVFLMLSGALLLNRDIEIKSFLKRKVPRIAYPFLFYFIIFWLSSFLLNREFSYTIFTYNWYFWMILGVYLSVPIINKFIQQTSESEIEYFLAIFVLAAIFYQITLIFGIEHYFDLNFFVAPIGYLVLGYYLSIKQFNIDSKKLIILMAVIFLTATFFKMLETGAVLPKNSILNYVATQTAIVGSWVDMSIFEILQAGSLFVLFKNLNLHIMDKVIVSISNVSYGMYLCNSLVMSFLIPIFTPIPSNGIEICAIIIVMILVVFVVSWILVTLISRIPVIGKYCT